MDDGDAAQAGQVVAGAVLAGAAVLPVPDVDEGVPDPDAFSQPDAPGLGGLALAQLGEQRLVGMDGLAAPGRALGYSAAAAGCK